MATREQERAHNAFRKVSVRKDGSGGAEYLGFSRSFPALIQTCGLAQAAAFALKKAPPGYMDDLAAVMKVVPETGDGLARLSRETGDIGTYQRLTREAISASNWLKRYSEALLKGKKG